jgi:hypothetical protein
MNHRLPAWLIACTVLVAFGPAQADPAHAVPGQKLDSGLGELPHYSKWLDKSGRNPLGNAVPGESLDSGLGDLPHYRFWVDPTGKDPLGRQMARTTVARR